MLDAYPSCDAQQSGTISNEPPRRGARLRRPPVIDPAAAASLPKPQRRAAQWLISKGYSPTLGAVDHLVRVRAQQGERIKRRRERLRELTPIVKHARRRDGRRAAAIVHAELQATGRPPSWRELRRLMGWPADGFWMVIKRLERDGWLTCTREPGSLRPGPRFTEGG